MNQHTAANGPGICNVQQFICPVFEYWLANTSFCFHKLYKQPLAISECLYRYVPIYFFIHGRWRNESISYIMHANISWFERRMRGDQFFWTGHYLRLTLKGICFLLYHWRHFLVPSALSRVYVYYLDPTLFRFWQNVVICSFCPHRV